MSMHPHSTLPHVPITTPLAHGRGAGHVVPGNPSIPALQSRRDVAKHAHHRGHFHRILSRQEGTQMHSIFTAPGDLSWSNPTTAQV